MIFHKIKSEIVSHLSYFIGSDNEAIVVDPMRDCQIYVELAMSEGLNIRYVFETHRNARAQSEDRSGERSKPF